MLMLSLSTLYVEAQFTEGIYKSSNESFGTNWYLIVKGEQLCLFGWELSTENDTLYFRSTAEFNRNRNITFNTFEFQKERITEENLKDFKPNDNLKIDSFFMYRYLVDIKEENGEISFSATKDIYDSRADYFKFLKVK